MAKSDKLPRQIFVTWKGDEKDRYLSVTEELDATVDAPGETWRVGIYELQELVDVKATVTAQRVASKKPRSRAKS